MANDARLDEPMSDARLREIRKGIEFNQMGMDEEEAIWAISDLLAEVVRLRARCAMDIAAGDGAVLDHAPAECPRCNGVGIMGNETVPMPFGIGSTCMPIGCDCECHADD